MKRLGLLAVALAGGLWAVWQAFVRRQGDSEMVWLSDHLDDLTRSDGNATGTIGIENRGRQLGVARRVEGTVVGGQGRVRATLQGSRPPERGWWVSNILKPGERCVAEIDVELESDPAGVFLMLELTALPLPGIDVLVSG